MRPSRLPSPLLLLAYAFCALLFFAPSLSYLHAQSQLDGHAYVEPPAAAAPVPVQNIPSPAAPQHAPDQIMWALIISYALQYLKKSSLFPWLTNVSSSRLQTQFGFVAALLTAAGVHLAVSGNLLDGSGFALSVTGVSLNVIKDVVFQWASQQGWYDLVVKRS